MKALKASMKWGPLLGTIQQWYQAVAEFWAAEPASMSAMVEGQGSSGPPETDLSSNHKVVGPHILGCAGVTYKYLQCVIEV